MNQNQPDVNWDKLLERLEKDESEGKSLTAQEQLLLGELSALKKEAYELLGDYQTFDTAAELKRVKARIKQHQEKRVVRLWPRIAVSAAAMLIISFAILWYTKAPVIKPAGQSGNQVKVEPGKNRAILTLENGEVIKLSEQQTGVVVSAAGMRYSDGSSVNKQQQKERNYPREIQSLTAATPRGGTYQVILPDGSKVWLNAATTISFPSRFTGSQRLVSLSGEAYFEVAKDKMHKFVVKTATQQLSVLGTHFNVMAYPEDPQVRTTLLEGVVQVSNKKGKSILLKPGEQSQLSAIDTKVSKGIDLEAVVAWKNGYFKFNESLESIMDKVSRWYDIKVSYDPGIDVKQSFSGKILRSRNISSVLKIMELTGKVKFKIEGRRVTVMQ